MTAEQAGIQQTIMFPVVRPAISQQQVWQTFPPNGAKVLLRRLSESLRVLDHFQLKLGWNPCAPDYISVNLQRVPLANYENEKELSTCRLHPSKTTQPASQRLLFMIWMERHVPLSVPPRPLLWDQHAAQPWPRSACSVSTPLPDVSFMISQSFFRCCCVLGVACYGVECLRLWWEVSPLSSSWLCNLEQGPFSWGCCCLGNELLFIQAFNQGLIPYLWRWWHEKKKHRECV